MGLPAKDHAASATHVHICSANNQYPVGLNNLDPRWPVTRRPSSRTAVFVNQAAERVDALNGCSGGIRA